MAVPAAYQPSFREAWQGVSHDLGIRKEPLPVQKYNAAQRIAYFSILVMGMGSLLTRLAIYKPTQLAGSLGYLAGIRRHG